MSNVNKHRLRLWRRYQATLESNRHNVLVNIMCTQPKTFYEFWDNVLTFNNLTTYSSAQQLSLVNDINVK